MLLYLSSTRPNPAPLRPPNASIIQYSIYCPRLLLSRESPTLVLPQHSCSWHVLLNPATLFAVRQQLRNTSSKGFPEIFSAGKKKKVPRTLKQPPRTHHSKYRSQQYRSRSFTTNRECQNSSEGVLNFFSQKKSGRDNISVAEPLSPIPRVVPHAKIITKRHSIRHRKIAHLRLHLRLRLLLLLLLLLESRLLPPLRLRPLCLKPAPPFLFLLPYAKKKKKETETETERGISV